MNMRVFSDWKKEKEELKELNKSSYNLVKKLVGNKRVEKHLEGGAQNATLCAVIRDTFPDSFEFILTPTRDKPYLLWKYEFRQSLNL